MNRPTVTSRAALPLLPCAGVSGRTLIWSLLAGLALTLPVLWLVGALPLPGLNEAMSGARAHRMMAFYARPWVIGLQALVVYPVLEEFFYRGLFQQLLRRYAPVGIAVAVPNVVFALSHFGAGWVNVGFALVTGLFLSWLVVQSRSLLPAMVCHSAVNLLAVFVLRPLADSGAFVPQPGPFPQSVEVLIMLVVSAALLAAGAHVLRAEFAGQRDLAARA